MNNSSGHELLIGGDQEASLTTESFGGFLWGFSFPPVDQLVGLGAVASQQAKGAKCSPSPL